MYYYVKFKFIYYLQFILKITLTILTLNDNLAFLNFFVQILSPLLIPRPTTVIIKVNHP